MEYSHWFTKVALVKDSKKLEASIENYLTIKAREY